MIKVLFENGCWAKFPDQKSAEEFTGVKQPNQSAYIKDGKYHKGLKWEWDEDVNISLSSDPNFNELPKNISFFTKKNGDLEHNINNYFLYLDNYEPYKDNICKNNLNGEVSFKGKMIDETLKSKIKMDMERAFNGKRIDNGVLEDAINNVGEENSFHPILDHIKQIEWDGQKRAERYFIDFLGADDKPINRKITSMFFYGAYKRLVEPGCDNDFCLVLIDETQGTGKSKSFDRLAYNYTYEISDFKNPQNWASGFKNNWFYMVNELNTNKKSSMDELKKYISLNFDDTRLAYRRDSFKYPRHGVFAATTNNWYIYRDYSSDYERRFLTLECFGVRRDSKWWNENLPDSYIDQIWAEVRTWYENNSRDNQLLSLNKDEEEELKEIQQRHKSCGNDSEVDAFVEFFTAKDFRIDSHSRLKYYYWDAFMKEATTNRIVNINYINAVEMKKVPTEWVKRRFKSKPEKYFEPIFKKYGWIRKNIKYYDGVELDCFVDETYNENGEKNKQLDLYEDIISEGNF